MTDYSVTIVIPCFNSGSTIVQTIDSVKSQTWDPIDIIVVDDGSTDNYTINVLESLTGITLIRQKNKGLPSARNAGIRASATTFILPLDADDWLECDAIQTLITPFLNNQNIDFVFPFIHLEGDASGVLRKSYNSFEQLFLNQIPYCLLYRKSTWQRIGGYDESMLSGYEDWDFNIRLLAHGYQGFIVELPLLHYRVSQHGMLISRSNKLHGLLWEYIQHKHSQLYASAHLYSLWLEWRTRPSTYPLLIYFPWLILHRLLPRRLFPIVFSLFRLHSHSRRLSRIKAGN